MKARPGLRIGMKEAAICGNCGHRIERVKLHRSAWGSWRHEDTRAHGYDCPKRHKITGATI